MLKRGFIYFLLGLLLINAGGFLIIFKFQQMAIYHQMDKSQKNIVTLVIPTIFFKSHLERDGKEIKWQGKMYDIKKVKYSHNNAIVNAIHDTKEDKLIGHLAGFLKTKDKHGHPANQSFCKLLKLEFYNFTFISNPLEYSIFQYNFTQTPKTLVGFLGYLAPPPQFI